VTLNEVVLTIKTLLACKSYGAETRIGGDMRNSIFGIVSGWEEVITPLELTLELYDQRDNISRDSVKKIVEKYKPLAGNPKKIKVFTPTEVDAMVNEAAETKLNKKFLESAYKDIEQYREAQKGKKKSGR
jgi:hypothetical protein